MSSVVNINRWDQSRFEKFAEESSYAFEEFMAKSHAYSPLKAYIYLGTENDPNIISTDVTKGKYADSLNVINYYNPSFRSVLPNMDGAMHSQSQTYGLFFMSFITGIHNIEIYKFFAECSPLVVQVDHMVGGGMLGGKGMNGQLLTKQSSSHFFGSHIIGFSKDINIVNLAVRYSKHELSHWQMGDDKSIKGHTVVNVDYAKMTTNKYQ